MEDILRRKYRQAAKGIKGTVVNHSIDGNLLSSEDRINLVLGKGPSVRMKTKSRERSVVKQKQIKIEKPIDKRSTSVKKEHAQSQLLARAARINSNICSSLDLSVDSDHCNDTDACKQVNAKPSDNYMNKIKGIYSSRPKDLSEKLSKYQRKNNFLTMSRPIEVNLANEGSLHSDEEPLIKNIFLRVAEDQINNPFQSKKQSKEEKTPMKTNTKHISLEVFNPKTPVNNSKENIKESHCKAKQTKNVDSTQLSTCEKKVLKSNGNSKIVKTRNKVIDYNNTAKENLNKMLKKKSISLKSSEKKQKQHRKDNDKKTKGKETNFEAMYDGLMEKHEEVYRAFELADLKNLTSQLGLAEEMHKRLSQSNRYIQQAHKSIFMFLNMFKDFETKLVLNPIIRENSKVSSICDEIHRDYVNASLHFSVDDSDIESEEVCLSWIDSYEKCMLKNQEFLDSINQSLNFTQIHKNIVELNNKVKEFRIEKGKSNEITVCSPVNLIESDSKDLVIDFSDYLAANSDQSCTPNATISTKFIEKISDKSKTLKSSNLSSLNMFSQIFSENVYNSNSITSRKEFKTNHQNNFDDKIKLLEIQVADMMKSETKLKGDISRLRIERDSYKSMLKNNSYFNELIHSISNISNCLLSNKAINDIKFSHQIVMKNLIDDSLSEKIREFDQKILEITAMNDKLKDLCKEEIQFSKELYSVALKYSLLSQSFVSLLKDEVRSITTLDIMTDFLSNMKSPTYKRMAYDNVISHVLDVINKDSQNLSKIILQTNTNETNLLENSHKDTEIFIKYEFMDNSNLKERLKEKDDQIRYLEEELSNSSMIRPKRLKKLKSVDSVGKLNRRAKFIPLYSQSIEFGCRNLAEISGQETLNSDPSSINNTKFRAESINNEQLNSKVSDDSEPEPKPVLFKNVYN